MLRQISFLLYVALAAAAIASAQVVTSTVYGAVLDQSGAFIPGAKIKVTNGGTGASTSGATNESGEFTLSSLQAGNYTFDTRNSARTLNRSASPNCPSFDAIGPICLHCRQASNPPAGRSA